MALKLINATKLQYSWDLKASAENICNNKRFEDHGQMKTQKYNKLFNLSDV